jgi:dipeptidyl aminopeptidase/acylaminoacyl peptidase
MSASASLLPRHLVTAVALFAPLLVTPHRAAAAQSPVGFTLEQVRSYPYPTELTAAGTGDRLAWVFNEQGQRNVWVADGPAFNARRLTAHERDDGQDLTALSVSPDGRWVVYVRGGDFGSNFDDALPVNPVGTPTPVAVQIWAVPFAGGTPVSLGSGESPVIAPSSDHVVFVRDRQLWRAPIDGSAPARRLFTLRGSAADPQFSPDGTRLAFVSNRGDHAFIGVFVNDTTPITWLAPSTDRDWSPRWAPDSRRLVFARRDGNGGPPPPPLRATSNPWSLWVGDAATGEAHRVWQSDTTLRASVPSTHGGINLHWAADDRLVFLQYADGWPHLYSMPAEGGAPLLLTPGEYMVEHVRLSPDRRTLLMSANAGSTPGDHDRRHVMRVPVDRSAPEVLTPGTGLEWMPVVTGSGRVAAIGATALRPPLPMVLDGTTPRWLAADRLPSTFPVARLITPEPVTVTASDGVRVPAQLFLPPGPRNARRPAIVYVHGGPPRQMLLGWHYGDYYANAYAMNQYLASRGFLVLSVNYRLGIGYGHDFHRPPNAGAQGAAEYLDVKAAGDWLAARADVDPARIGIYGGSYGGYLTALALARDSKRFAAGVDIHGVHDFTADGGSRFGGSTWRYERHASEVQQLADVAWQSSPVSSVHTWTSPVLLIHADDDRNVRFAQTVDLVQRLRTQGVPFEAITIPDDTHHWMRHANQLRVNRATAEFFERQLRP